MHLVRYEHQGAIRHGILKGDTIAEIEGDFFGALERAGESVALDEVKLKAPTVPGKILNAAGNYPSHMAGAPKPERPRPFLAPSSSVADPGGNVVMPEGVEVSYEGEMAVVIGERCFKVPPADVKDHILGVCAANDVSAYGWIGADGDWWRGKGTDTFSPFGPWITTGLDYGDLRLTTRVNGAVVEDTNTSQMFYGVDEFVSFVSQYMTLEPGDVVFTGTSGVSTPLVDGDVVEVVVEGNGVLQNTFVAANSTSAPRT